MYLIFNCSLQIEKKKDELGVRELNMGPKDFGIIIVEINIQI